MALHKELEKDNTGIIASYWRIIQTVRNYDRKELVVDLAAYLTDEDRIAGKNPVDTRQIMYKINEVDETRDQVYTLLKNPIMAESTDENGQIMTKDVNEFTNSVDC